MIGINIPSFEEGKTQEQPFQTKSGMIVPHSKLLVSAASVVLPSALLAAAMTSADLLSLTFVCLFGLAVITDAFFARQSLAGIGIELPPVGRMSKDLEGTVEVRIRDAAARGRSLRIALELPPEIPATSEELD